MFAPMKLKKNDRVDIRCAVTAGGDVWAGSDNKQRGLTNFRGFKIFGAKDPNAIAFQAVLPKAVKVSNGQVVPYTHMHLSVGGGYDAKKARFTAPVSGVYSFGVNQLSGGGTGAVELAFHKNGGVYNVSQCTSLKRNALLSHPSVRIVTSLFSTLYVNITLCTPP